MADPGLGKPSVSELLVKAYILDQLEQASYL
jgi:hypothetical protein